MLARAEFELLNSDDPPRFMNQALEEKFPDCSNEGIKDKRRKQSRRDRVEQLLAEKLVAQMPTVPEGERVTRARATQLRSAGPLASVALTEELGEGSLLWQWLEQSPLTSALLSAPVKEISNETFDSDFARYLSTKVVKTAAKNPRQGKMKKPQTKTQMKKRAAQRNA